MNAYFKKWHLLLTLLLGMVAGQAVQASCIGIGPRMFTPTLRIDITAPVGAIMYDETWTQSVSVACSSGSANQIISTLFKPESPHFLIDGANGSTAHTFESSVSFAGIEQSVSGSDVIHLLPPGTYGRTLTATVNLRYRRGPGVVTSSMLPKEGASFGSFNTFGPNDALDPTIYLGRNILLSTATCAINSQTVPMPPAPLTSFTGIGSVPNAGRTDFDVSFLCTNVNAGVRVGLSFSTSDQHASQASGVIRTNQDANNAKDIALQLINRTTSLPIKFGQFEPGVAKTGNGQYHNIYRVQYFQSGANPTAGAVTGQTTASVVYQ